jgi:hypothetical protein
MKYLGIIVFLLLISSVQSPLEQVRSQFPYISSLAQADAFLEKLKNDNSPEAKGYNAAMILMKSRYVKSPFSKLKHFKKGKKILDKDIVENPECLEIRYIRFLMQKQIPNFLGYNKNIEEDFNILFNKLSSSALNKDFKTKMLNNMLLVDDLSETKKNKIHKILDTL